MSVHVTASAVVGGVSAIFIAGLLLYAARQQSAVPAVSQLATKITAGYGA